MAFYGDGKHDSGENVICSIPRRKRKIYYAIFGDDEGHITSITRFGAKDYTKAEQMASMENPRRQYTLLTETEFKGLPKYIRIKEVRHVRTA